LVQEEVRGLAGLGQTLRALLADYQQRLEDLLPLRQLLKGSVYELPAVPHSEIRRRIEGHRKKSAKEPEQVRAEAKSQAFRFPRP
jgi:hypothetical protein